MSNAAYREYAQIFDCEGCRLVGIIAQPSLPKDIGVVIIVGGPQYRAGSHRQFTLLARFLAEHRIASIRFDYRGMGDSEGEMRNFEQVNADICAAVNQLMVQVPQVRHIALWGLCDAASAALYYGSTDARVSKMILLNPWVHTPATAAQARLRGYYLKRLCQPNFWKKLFSGKINLGESARDIGSAGNRDSARGNIPADPRHGGAGYVERMLTGLNNFPGHTLFLLSGNDLTAQEFLALTRNDKNWKKVCRSPKIANASVADANHTFSTHTWRNLVNQITTNWLDGQ